VSEDVMIAKTSRRPSFEWTPEPREPWVDEGLCTQTDPEMFFPELGGSTRSAKKVCASCEVKERCLQYALENDERFGVWGGLSERERRKLRKAAVA
jgi:WhiB family transcriptional regulator, redox-sensing transcriptional regulator